MTTQWWWWRSQNWCVVASFQWNDNSKYARMKQKNPIYSSHFVLFHFCTFFLILLPAFVLQSQIARFNWIAVDHWKYWIEKKKKIKLVLNCGLFFALLSFSIFSQTFNRCFFYLLIEIEKKSKKKINFYCCRWGKIWCH